jgi:cellulose synthase/poly-beta-1,6-N-acetylglucosamine synthase-like glycosyltransferase
MPLSEVLFALVVIYVVAWALYVVALPVIASMQRPRVAAMRRASKATPPNVAVIIPAYNMEDWIGRCIRSIQSANYPAERISIFVVTDHCTDSTAQVVLGMGVSVLARDDGLRGKTYALAWAFDALRERKVFPDLYVIVDATAYVDAEFFSAIATRWIEGDDIVIGHPVVDQENQEWFAQCLGLTLAHRNLQNWARGRLGLSAFISGRGMAYGRRYIEKYGWSLALPGTSGMGAHPTEDWRHGVRIVEEGIRAAFADDARVFTPLRGSFSAATEQGIRWERGRILNTYTHGTRLLLKGLRQRNLLMTIGGIDAIQPPVAVLLGLSLFLAVLDAMVPGLGFRIGLEFVPIVLLTFYGLVVVARGRLEGIALRSIMWAPVYVGWRCIVFARAMIRLLKI